MIVDNFTSVFEDIVNELWKINSYTKW
jgi:hypothetical protein